MIGRIAASKIMGIQPDMVGGAAGAAIYEEVTAPKTQGRDSLPP
jgi:hypothetical protein